MNDTVAIEAALDLIVAERNLEPGSRLPSLGELASQLDCDPDTLVLSLEAAAAKSKLARTADGGYEVAQPSVTGDGLRFSFSNTAAQFQKRLITKLLEGPPTRRLPVDEQHPLHATECRAQEALGLAPDQPFYFICRVRHHDGKPKVFHRIYLDPARFAPDLIENYDFENQSVMALYRQAGYLLLSRDTVLHARLTFFYEDTMLRDLARKAYKQQHHQGLGHSAAPELGHLRRESSVQPVLHAEQSFWAAPATDPEGSEGRFVLEYMQATYFDHWQYSIHNRAPEG